MGQAPTARDQRWVYQVTTLVYQQQEDINRDHRLNPAGWQTWARIVTELLEAAATSNLSPQEGEKILQLVRPFENESFSDPARFHKALAQMWFSLSNFKEAASHWEKANSTNHRDYFLGKGRVTPFPQCLSFFESAQDWDSIVMKDEENRGAPLSREDFRRIFRACSEKGRLRRAAEVAAVLDPREFSERWASFVENKDILDEELRHLVERAWSMVVRNVRSEIQSFPGTGSGEDDRDFEDRVRAEANRRWSFVMLDALELIHENRQRFAQFDRQRTWYPLLHGLSLGSDPGAVAGRFRTIWERRQERPERWQSAHSLLNSLINFSLELLEEKWRLQKAEDVGWLTQLVLGLVWGNVVDEFRSEKQGGVDEQGGKQVKRRKHDGELDAYFDQLVPRVYLRSEGAGEAALFEPGDFAPEFVGLARKAMGAVADAPADILRGLTGREFRDLRDLLDGIGYALFKQVQSFARTAQKGPSADLESWWMLAGKFINRVPFTKLAVQFFKELQRIRETVGVSLEFEHFIKTGLHEAESALVQLREERGHWRVDPGQERKERDLLVRSLAERAEIIIEVLPGYEQLRLSLDLKPHPAVALRQPPEFGVKKSQSGSAHEWVVRTPDGRTINIVWEQGDEKVRIQGEAKFDAFFAGARQIRSEEGAR